MVFDLGLYLPIIICVGIYQRFDDFSSFFSEGFNKLRL